MATLSTTRNYDDGQVLTKADLDAFLDDIESFLNSTKINDDNIQNSGITGSTKLLNQSVTAAKLASDSVETAKIATSAVTTAKIADSAVTTGKINDLAVTTAKLAADAVTTAKILDANVTTAKIADDAVTTVKILDSNVTTAKINDLAVTTAKINDGAITPAKQSTYYALTTVATDASWTNGEVKSIGSITCYGRPVVISVTAGQIYYFYSSASSVTITLEYSADNTNWSTVETFIEMDTIAYIGEAVEAQFSPVDPVLAFNNVIFRGIRTIIHTPTAGTAYYRLKRTTANGTLRIDTALTVLIQEL